MNDPARLLELIDSIYAAATCDEQWPVALTRLAAFTGGHGVVHLRADPASETILDGSSVGVDVDAFGRYLRHWTAIDPRNSRLFRSPIGIPITQQSILDSRTLLKSEFYNDFLVPHGCTEGEIMVALLERTASMITSVAIQRSVRDPAFSEREARRFALVVPHLMRALEIRHSLQEARQAAAAHLEVINRMPFGVVFLDHESRLVEVSRIAEAMLRTGEGLGFRDGALVAQCPGDDRALQKVLLQTLRARQRGHVPGGTVLLRRTPPRSPLRVEVIPAPEQQRLVSARPACVLVIFDPDSAAVPDVDLVMRALGLTRSEAQLACTLLGGRSLQEAAIERERSINTCKTQLKSIYAKTGCRNQTGLARCLLQVGLTGGFQGADGGPSTEGFY